MNPFTDHPQQQGVTYQAHMIFAIGIAMRLFNSAIAFYIHAIFPFVGIRRTLDLEATACYLWARNDWIETMKRNKSSDTININRNAKSFMTEEQRSEFQSG